MLYSDVTGVLQEDYMIGDEISKLKKILRYFSIIGIRRTMIKIAGRSRSKIIPRPFHLFKNQFIGLIGCGQFQFSVIAFYLSRGLTNKFLFCLDVDRYQSESLGLFYSIPNIFSNEMRVSEMNETELVYIASNHSSHAEYAIKFLEKNINVYSEKPIAVNFDQFEKLLTSIKSSKANYYAGYNRPYSPAVQKLKRKFLHLGDDESKFTINCFVSAHVIPREHWYREPAEGTRICGNVGHWIDLIIHMLNWRGDLPEKYKILVSYSDIDHFDDDISISIVTEKGDLSNIVITSRGEPFEGINETINFQYNKIIAKIDDFRKMTIWKNSEVESYKYSPKDVGHKRSVQQPFSGNNRDLQEVFVSTEIMLHISDMVKVQQTEKTLMIDRRKY